VSERLSAVARTLRVYDSEADAYIAHWGRRRYRVPPLLKALLAELAPGSRVLDLGCGPGQDGRRLRARGVWAVGLDGAFNLLSWARQTSPDAPLVRVDFGRCPCEGKHSTQSGQPRR